MRALVSLFCLNGAAAFAPGLLKKMPTCAARATSFEMILRNPRTRGGEEYRSMSEGEMRREELRRRREASNMADLSRRRPCAQRRREDRGSMDRYEYNRFAQPRYEQPRFEQQRFEQPRYDEPRYSDWAAGPSARALQDAPEMLRTGLDDLAQNPFGWFLEPLNTLSDTLTGDSGRRGRGRDRDPNDVWSRMAAQHIRAPSDAQGPPPQRRRDADFGGRSMPMGLTSGAARREELRLRREEAALAEAALRRPSAQRRRETREVFGQPRYGAGEMRSASMRDGGAMAGRRNPGFSDRWMGR